MYAHPCTRCRPCSSQPLAVLHKQRSAKRRRAGSSGHLQPRGGTGRPVRPGTPLGAPCRPSCHRRARGRRSDFDPERENAQPPREHASATSSAPHDSSAGAALRPPTPDTERSAAGRRRSPWAAGMMGRAAVPAISSGSVPEPPRPAARPDPRIPRPRPTPLPGGDSAKRGAEAEGSGAPPRRLVAPSPPKLPRALPRPAAPRPQTPRRLRAPGRAPLTIASALHRNR